MEHIANLTLGQIGTYISTHQIQIILWALGIDNLLITAFAAAGWNDTFLQQFAKFLTSFLTSMGKKVLVVPPKTVPVILLCLGLVFSFGCASSAMKSGCGHVNGNEVTIPYVGGKANGNAYGCYMSCIGSNCKAPDYAVLESLTSDYIKYAPEDTKITTTSAGTITFTPAIK